MHALQDSIRSCMGHDLTQTHDANIHCVLAMVLCQSSVSILINCSMAQHWLKLQLLNRHS